MSGLGGDVHSYGWVNNAGTSGGHVRRRLGAFAKPVEVWALAAWAGVADKLPFRSYDEGQNSRAGSDRGKRNNRRAAGGRENRRDGRISLILAVHPANLYISPGANRLVQLGLSSSANPDCGNVATCT